MNKFVIGFGAAMMASATVLSLSAFSKEPTIRSNTVVEGVNLGDLLPEEARFKLRSWWESERQKKLILKSPHLVKGLPGMTPGQLGITLDDEATIAQLPTQSFVESIYPGEDPEVRFAPIYKTNGAKLDGLKKAVAEAVPTAKPAQVRYVKGSFSRKSEVAGFALDVNQVEDSVLQSLREKKGTVDLPIVQAPKTVTDEDLDGISEIVSSFSTRFPINKNRNENIRLASAMLDGIVLAPGQRLSFNDTVGRRTTARGYKEAGVYINGRHDTGVGGGICQVSTTLYNASLFGNLAIPVRRNHSMPVAYVPVGRDATVNYGSHDLVIENNYPHPIAINSEYRPGQLTFRVLGKKVPGMEVKIERANIKSWDTGVKTVVDTTLPAGTKKVVEKGSAGHSVTTTRVVMIDGKVVSREPLGRSYYPGGKRIVAVGPAKPAAPKPVPPVQDSGGPEQIDNW